MDILLDTHSMIWFINGENIPSKSKLAIQDTSNNCYISIASLWEIAIKLSINKLEMNIAFDQVEAFIIENKINLLPVTVSHLKQLQKLALIHLDPFDRIIISQALANHLTIVSKDQIFKQYNVHTLWK
ncbi:MAG: type II toxin-antitoxin system VapC family toxin [Chitinophagaceae bacterium]|jgi:PIN domain nuclease of toxin-antitoxin system|nr:type II toxin-antitoxin system VapC family toxin [Chitinophagaceae bacterium]